MSFKLRFFERSEWSKLRLEGLRKSVSKRLSDYASPEEIRELKDALVSEFKHMNYHGEELRSRREDVMQCLKFIKRDILPVHHIEGVQHILAPFKARYEAAKDNVQDDEDEAWALELKRRADLEARYGVAA